MKKKGISLIIVLITILSITACQRNPAPDILTNTADDNIKIEDKKEKFSVINKEDEYQKILLRFGHDNNPEPSELFASYNFLDTEKEINLTLNQNHDYIELKFQPLHYIGNYTGKKGFAISEDTINQEINTGLESFISTDLKTMQIGERFFMNFPLQISKGRTFESKDFIISEENEMVNIILGSNYVNEYNLNDVLNLELATKEIKLRIIGFLEKDVTLSARHDNKPLEDIILNDYIIMPFYDIEYSPNSEEEKLYQQIWYSLKNEGFIRPNKEETIDNLKKDIDIINKEYDLFFDIVNLPVSLNLK